MTAEPDFTDGFLRASEVMRLKMNTDVVCLPSCRTGNGKRPWNDGALGMARAFQHAGARAALVSLWQLPDEVSSLLLGTFLEQQKAGKNRLDALAVARNELRKRRYDHPYYWGCFVLAGEKE
jgi:CHAT domain-containing protein